MEKDRKKKWWAETVMKMEACGAGHFRSPDFVFKAGSFAPFLSGKSDIFLAKKMIEHQEMAAMANGIEVTDLREPHRLAKKRTHGVMVALGEERNKNLMLRDGIS